MVLLSHADALSSVTAVFVLEKEGTFSTAVSLMKSRLLLLPLLATLGGALWLEMSFQTVSWMCSHHDWKELWDGQLFLDFTTQPREKSLLSFKKRFIHFYFTCIGVLAACMSV